MGGEAEEEEGRGQRMGKGKLEEEQEFSFKTTADEDNLSKYSCGCTYNEPVQPKHMAECAETSYYFQSDSTRVRFACQRIILFISNYS